MAFIPIAFQLEGHKVLIVGAGKVALHKLKAIAHYTSAITLLAPWRTDGLEAYEWREKTFEAADIDGFTLVYACTDSTEVNEAVAVACRSKGILVNVADNPALSDFVSPAIEKRGDISIAVSSNGRAVKTSLKVRQWIQENLPHDLI